LQAVIFANGEFTDSKSIQTAIKTADMVIAADGGARHCQALQIRPDVLLGDFDSLTREEVEEMASNGTQVIRHPSRKDYTDLELALQYAQDAGVNEVLVLAALGMRWDQTLANLLLPASQAFSGLVIRLLDGEQEVNLLKGGQTINLQGQPGDTVSLIPLCSDSQGITTGGLEYALEDGTLLFGSTRGISNQLTSQTGWVSMERGLLAISIIHHNSKET
jgi:thiamine pyrophosphokinase